MHKVRLQDLTWVEVKEKLREGATAIVPFGSQEEHGPQTPMGDFIIWERVAMAVAERTGAVVAPVIPFGYSEFFKSYPGTITVRPITLEAVLEDYVDCLIRSGFERIVFLNGHVGNNGVLEHVCRRLHAERGVRIPVLSPIAFRKPEVMKQLFADGTMGHGGESTTSLQAYLNPTAMRLDLAVPGTARDFYGLKVKPHNQVDFHGVPVTVYLNYDEVTDPSGVIGDARGASADKGKVVFDMMVEGCSAFVEWFKEIPARV